MMHWHVIAAYVLGHVMAKVEAIACISLATLQLTPLDNDMLWLGPGTMTCDTLVQ